MCVPVLGLIGTLASVAGSAAGIMQGQQQAAMAQQQANMQAKQARRQAEVERQAAQSQFNNSVMQARNQRQQQITQHQGQVASQQAAQIATQQQYVNNAEASNKVYMQEQYELKEARDQAAFKSQEIYAKQIGEMGKVLATPGRAGQSVGVIANDVDRQAGLAFAKEAATLRSAELQSAIEMDVAYTKEESANNNAWSNAPAPVQAPWLVNDPQPPRGDISYTGSLGIPTYSWS